MKDRIVIGVTDCSKYTIYQNWILQFSDEVEVMKLSYRDNNLEDIKKCNGVLLTGGEDVHPRFYNKPEYYELCCKEDINERRDAFECNVLEYTERNRLPVLGICRGLQVANVFFGGLLIPDILIWGKTNHSKQKDGQDRYHAVQVNDTSWLYNIVGEKEDNINSNHHQSVDQLGEGLVISALSSDGIIEAIEREDIDSGSFLCLVQWHPERMKNQNSPFVKNVRQAFMDAAKTYRNS